MALGATVGDIFNTIIREGLTLGLTGLVPACLALGGSGRLDRACSSA